MSAIRRTALGMLLSLSVAAAAAAQATGVSQADVQRLQDSVLQAGAEVAQLRSRDAARAERLQIELDELREEVIYLKVKLRKENAVPRAEYASVRDRLDDLRSRATADVAPAAPSRTAAGRPAAQPSTGSRPSTTQSSNSGAQAAGTQPGTGASSQPAGGAEVPAGTEVDVRLLNALNSGTAQVEDRFEGATLVDLTVNGRVLIPAGSIMRGVVSAVEPATRTNRTARMTVTFDQITVSGRTYPVRATVTQALQGEGIRGEAGRVGVGAGVGAVLGGILGGFKGALAGILIGGGGTIAATEGREIELPQGTVLRVRFDSPLNLGP